MLISVHGSDRMNCRASCVVRRASFVTLPTGRQVRHSSFAIRHSSSKGFSLIELLIAITIMIIALAPIMDSITGSLQSGHKAEENTIIVNYTREKMDDILAMDFSTIDISSPSGTPTALSDTVTVLGKTMDRDVLVELYDGDGDSLSDNDLIKISVQIKGYQLETLLANF